LKGLKRSTPEVAGSNPAPGTTLPNKDVTEKLNKINFSCHASIYIASQFLCQFFGICWTRLYEAETLLSP
jgi:hypothetical protein